MEFLPWHWFMTFPSREISATKPGGNRSKHGKVGEWGCHSLGRSWIIYTVVPSGNLLHSYWTWPIEIVDFPMKHGDFPVRFLYVYQRVTLTKIQTCFHISQIGSSSQLLGKIIQMFETTNQYNQYIITLTKIQTFQTCDVQLGHAIENDHL